MAITPWFVNDTSAWTIQLVPDSGPFNVVGYSPANFTMIFRNTDANGIVDVPGQGTFSNLVPASGDTPATIQYQPDAFDVMTPGNYHVFVKISPYNKVVDLGTWVLKQI